MIVLGLFLWAAAVAFANAGYYLTSLILASVVAAIGVYLWRSRPITED